MSEVDNLMMFYSHKVGQHRFSLLMFIFMFIFIIIYILYYVYIYVNITSIGAQACTTKVSLRQNDITSRFLLPCYLLRHKHVPERFFIRYISKIYSYAIVS